MKNRLLVAAALLFLTAPAFAYIGPGAGITLFSSIWGIIVAAFVGLFAILRWPFRYMWRRMMRKTRSGAETTSEDTGKTDAE